MSWQFRGRPAIVEDIIAARRAKPSPPPRAVADAERASSSGRPVTPPPDAGPVATAAAAAVDAVDAYLASVRAPWVPGDTAPVLTAAQAKRLDTAFDRHPNCGVCSVRYSRCYPCNHGGNDA